jgi:predicted transcriptional regulator
MGLANYVAGALCCRMGNFAAAESLRYDMDLLARRFGVGFETVCHRLSTLQRAEAPGVPFFFIRVDRAGNISKRQSATHFHFSKTGGTCPLWVVYEAFTQPGRIVPQLASMPDGRVYLWIARTISRAGHGWGRQARPFPSAWAATCSMRRGWCIPRAWTCVTWRLRPPSAWAARSASAMHARSPLWASRCV